MRLSEETKSSIIALMFMFMFITLIGAIWYVFRQETNRSSSDVSLRLRCNEAGGSLIEGVTDTSGEVTHFSICVPAEAFYCSDIE